MLPNGNWQSNTIFMGYANDGSWSVSARTEARSGSPNEGIYLGLFRYLKRVVDLDVEVTHRAFRLDVPQQQPHSSKLLRSAYALQPPADSLFVCGILWAEEGR